MISWKSYKELDSTETGLVRVHNDILMAIDLKQSVVLVLLDLLVAFKAERDCHLGAPESLPRCSTWVI